MGRWWRAQTHLKSDEFVEITPQGGAALPDTRAGTLGDWAPHRRPNCSPHVARNIRDVAASLRLHSAEFPEGSTQVARGAHSLGLGASITSLRHAGLWTPPTWSTLARNVLPGACLE